jgi:predicted transcriptional regulator
LEGMPGLVHERRLAMDLSYQQLGRLVGMPASSLHKFEHGGNSRLSTVTRLLRWLAEQEAKPDTQADPRRQVST